MTFDQILAVSDGLSLEITITPKKKNSFIVSYSHQQRFPVLSDGD